MKNVIISVGTGIFNSRLAYKEIKVNPDFGACYKKCKPYTKEHLEYGGKYIEVLTKDILGVLGNLNCQEIDGLKSLDNVDSVALLSSNTVLSVLACKILKEYLENEGYVVELVSEYPKKSDILIPCNEETVVQDVIFACKNAMEIVDVQFTNASPKPKQRSEWKKWGRLID